MKYILLSILTGAFLLGCGQDTTSDLREEKRTQDNSGHGLKLPLARAGEASESFAYKEDQTRLASAVILTTKYDGRKAEIDWLRVYYTDGGEHKFDGSRSVNGKGSRYVYILPEPRKIKGIKLRGHTKLIIGKNDKRQTVAPSVYFVDNEEFEKNDTTMIYTGHVNDQPIKFSYRHEPSEDRIEELATIKAGLLRYRVVGAQIADEKNKFYIALARDEDFRAQIAVNLGDYLTGGNLEDDGTKVNIELKPINDESRGPWRP